MKIWSPADDKCTTTRYLVIRELIFPCDKGFPKLSCDYQRVFAFLQHSGTRPPGRTVEYQKRSQLISTRTSHSLDLSGRWKEKERERRNCVINPVFPLFGCCCCAWQDFFLFPFLSTLHRSLSSLYSYFFILEKRKQDRHPSVRQSDDLIYFSAVLGLMRSFPCDLITKFISVSSQKEIFFSCLLNIFLCFRIPCHGDNNNAR